MCPPPVGNPIRYLVIRSDGPPGPGDLPDRSPPRPIPPGRSDPQACHQLETQLQDQLREFGADHRRMDLQSPRAARQGGHARPDLFPGHLVSPPLQDPNRQVATLFGTITLWRMLYQPLHGLKPSIFPLEIRLGLEAGLATPGLAERAAQAAITSPQRAVLTLLKDAHGVSSSVASLPQDDRGRGGGGRRASPQRASRPTPVVAGAGGPILGGSQAGAGRGAMG